MSEVNEGGVANDTGLMAGFGHEWVTVAERHRTLCDSVGGGFAGRLHWEYAKLISICMSGIMTQDARLVRLTSDPPRGLLTGTVGSTSPSDRRLARKLAEAVTGSLEEPKYDLDIKVVIAPLASVVIRGQYDHARHLAEYVLTGRSRYG